MKKLSTKWFTKWARKSGLKNENMIQAIENLENDLSTANLVPYNEFSCFLWQEIEKFH